MSDNPASEENQLRVRPGLTIPRGELVLRATRASGPGGQHVNTSSTRIELLWNVRTSAALTPEEVELLTQRVGKRIDAEGWLRVVAAESRSQLRNRKQAEERLVKIIQQGLHVPRKRRPTKPTAASRRERLRVKHLHSEKKKERRRKSDD